MLEANISVSDHLPVNDILWGAAQGNIHFPGIHFPAHFVSSQEQRLLLW